MKHTHFSSTAPLGLNLSCTIANQAATPQIKNVEILDTDVADDSTSTSMQCTGLGFLGADLEEIIELGVIFTLPCKTVSPL
jgi:hypothetical protein